MKADWEALPGAILRRVNNEATGADIGTMTACAKADPKRYAKVNAETMAPVYEKRERERAEAKAAAEAEAEAQRKRLEQRMRQQAENLTKAIDQRLAEHGVPSAVKPRKG